EERSPAVLAVPLLSGGRPRGALVLQRAQGPFSEADLLLAVTATRPLAALIEAQRPAGAHMILHGEGNGRARALGVATILSRALPRRDPRRPPAEQLTAAFAAVREEVLQLAERARGAGRHRRNLRDGARAFDRRASADRSRAPGGVRSAPGLRGRLAGRQIGRRWGKRRSDRQSQRLADGCFPALSVHVTLSSGRSGN